MLVLGHVVFAGWGAGEWQDFGGDASESGCGKFGGVVFYDLAGALCLLFGVGAGGVDRGAVLRSGVVALSVALCWVVGFHGFDHEFVEGDLCWVVDDFDDFGVVGASGAGFAVGGVRCDSTGEAYGGVHHAWGFPEQFFCSPVAADTYIYGFGAWLTAKGS